MNQEIDPEFLTKLDVAAKSDPMNLLGTEIELHGQKFRFRKVIGSGAEKVVFELEVVATRKTANFVIRAYRKGFDPRVKLQEIIQEETLRTPKMDEGRVIAACDKMLSLYPDDGVAAFNRGVALARLKEYDMALDSFDLAISIDPELLTNWLQKAACLAECQRDYECFDCLRVAGELDEAQTRELLTKAACFRDPIAKALNRLVSVDGETSPVAEARRKYFVSADV